MEQTIRTGLVFGLTLLLLLAATPALAAIGKVSSATGVAFAQRDDGTTRDLEEGDSVYRSDTIVTERGGEVGIRFRDDTEFRLGPNSKFRVESYQYDVDNNEGPSFTAKMIRGAFRFVSGLIAKKKPESFKVDTPVATIGVRGTHVVGEVGKTSATVILVEGEDGSVGAINVSNDYGAVDIDQAGYGTEVPDEFSPPSTPRRMRQGAVENITRSLRSIQRSTRPILR